MTAPQPAVKVLFKALDIVECLKTRPNGVSLSDLTREVELPKATVYRIVTTLESRGYVGRGANGEFQLTRKLFGRGDGAPPMEQLLVEAAAPPMIALVEYCRETVNLGILDGGEVVVVHTVESPQAVRMTSKVGNRRYLHTTALGKVLLSGMTDRAAAQLLRLKGAPALTPHSLKSREAIAREIRRVRETGFAIDDRENEMEGRCMAMPIALADGSVIAALSISTPVFRMDRKKLEAMAPRLKQCCLSISKALRGA